MTPSVKSTTTLDGVLDALERKVEELRRGIEPVWRCPPKAPRRGPAEPPAPTWTVYEPHREFWTKNRKHWFYTDLELPQRRTGLKLAGTTANIFILGWAPFTVWIDGEELFRETRAWAATGPISEPFPVPVEPGRTYRIVACVEPTEVLDPPKSFQIDIELAACTDLAVDLDAAAMQLKMAAALASSDRDQQVVGRAAAAVDLAAVKSNRWTAVRASIDRMESMLMPLSAQAKAVTVHLLGHAHTDMDWMWTWDDTVKCIRRDFKIATDLMDEYPDLTFIHSQVPTYDLVRRHDPDVFAKVKKRIREGRWENAAGTWVEGDLNMADGESIARHMLYAKQWTRKHFDSEATAFWEPDTFGHPGNIPQLAALGEFDSYFHMRCNPGLWDNWPIRNWTGVDGSRITTFSKVYNDTLAPDAVVETAIRNYRKGIRNALHIWGIGNHGGGMARHQIEIMQRYHDRPLIPTIRFSSMKDVVAAVHKEKPELPANTGETYTVFEGCFTTHAAIKRYNRECEGQLITAETLCALASLDRRRTLANAWTPVLFNQFHDIFDGASVHDTYIDAHRRSEKSFKTARKVTTEALAVLVKPERGGKTVTVFNPCGFVCTEVVRTKLPRGTVALADETGAITPVQKLDTEHAFIAQEVPAFSYRHFRILTTVPRGTDLADVPVTLLTEHATGGYYQVDTATASLKISRDSGAIASYFDKRLARDLIAFGAARHIGHDVGTPSSRAELALNVFQLVFEAPNPMSAWLINDILREEYLLRNARVTLVETGPVFARFHVTHRFYSSRIDEEILVYKDFPRVDFDAEIDWQEKGSADTAIPQLKISFATGMTAARVRSEGPFLVSERAADGIEYSTQKFCDLSGDEFGFALYNDSKYGYDALGGRLRMTLLRSSYAPDPDPDSGRHRVRFAFAPHGGKSNAELVRAGMAYNRRPIAATTKARVRPAPSAMVIKGGSVVCTSLRLAESQEGLVMRLFETDGKRCRARLRVDTGTTAAIPVNLLERPVGKPLKIANGTVSLNFRPHEVKTMLLTT